MTVSMEQHIAPAVVEEEFVEDTLSDIEENKEAIGENIGATYAARETLLSPTKAAIISAAETTAAPKATKVKRLALVSSEDLKTPIIAVPTIAVAAGSIGIWASIMYCGAYKKSISPLLSFPFMTAAIFAAFTPVHDGTHSSIAKGKYKVPVNNIVGYLSGFPLMTPFGIYR
jgi:fatty acid desaturase